MFKKKKENKSAAVAEAIAPVAAPPPVAPAKADFAALSSQMSQLRTGAIDDATDLPVCSHQPFVAPFAVGWVCSEVFFAFLPVSHLEVDSAYTPFLWLFSGVYEDEVECWGGCEREWERGQT